MAERSILQAAQAMSGSIISGDPETRWSGATLDSRRIRGGELFFALPGENVDGHQFAARAVERGAAGAVIHHDLEVPSKGTWIRVDDTYQALHALTRAIRDELPENLVAITGSSGKTTTKELLAAVLERRFRVARSPGNFNNLYGFPLALLGIPDDTQWMVAEMGMSIPGELAEVSRLGRPDIAVFTNVRPVHLENFSSLAAIAEAKAELMAGLSESGRIVANADDPEVMRIVEREAKARPGLTVVTYGIKKPADVSASSVQPLANGVLRPGSRFELSTAAGRRTVELPIHGLYNVENFLAAAACGSMLGISLDDMVAAAADFRPASMRGELHRLADGLTVIDDSYNSNPDAAARALESARMLPAVRRIAILGDMLELGPDEAEFHRRVGRRAAELGFDCVIAVGQISRHLKEGAEAAGGKAMWLPNSPAALDWLKENPSIGGKRLGCGDLVLVKGSRGVGLEVMVQEMVQSHGVVEEQS